MAWRIEKAAHWPWIIKDDKGEVRGSYHDAKDLAAAVAFLMEDRDRLRRLVRCETIQPPADVTDDQTTELAVELAYLKEERDRLAAIVAKTPQWLPGGAQGGALEMEFGDHFIAAVRVCSADKSKEWWELSVVEITSIAQDDTGEYYGLSVDGCGWGWDWGDVEWYIPVKAVEETLPPYEADRKEPT